MKGRKDSSYRIISVGVILLLLLSFIDLNMGEMRLNYFGMDQLSRDIFFKLRLPRLLTAILAGAGLSLAGAQMQSIFRNPLADPHIMGVSGGAGLGAASAIILMGGSVASLPGGIGLALAAFLGAVLISSLVMATARKIGSASTLLLFGVMIGFILSSINSIIQYSASEESLKMYYSWSAGSFSNNSMTEVLILALAVLSGSLIALANSRGLDLVLFGDDYAQSTGADPSRIRRLSLLSCCLIAGTATAFCGPIGFVGIIGPHIARWILGKASYRHILPASILSGSIIAVIADILSLTIDIAIPVGSAMALIGIPVILTILWRNNDRT